MIVKTRLTNPTDTKQRYHWVPRHGMFIGPKESAVIDGDIYTLSGTYLKDRKCIEEDIKTGRIIIELITDLKTVLPDVAKLEAKLPPVVPAKPAKPVEPEKPKAEVKPVEPTEPVNIFGNTIEDEQHNILGKGLVEGGIEESRPPAYSPTTGEMLEEQPKPVDDINMLWEKQEELPVLSDVELSRIMGTLELPEGEGFQEVKPPPARSEIEKMTKKQLVELAEQVGLALVQGMNKADILQALLDFLKL